MKCKECVHYKLCRDLFCQVDTLTNDDKKCDYFEQKRPHGEWIEKEDYNMDTYYDCSACGNSWCTLDGTPWQNKMNFCPNCGADMREGEQK